MNFFVVVLALLLVGNNADQSELSLPELPESIDNLNNLDQNEPNEEEYKDVNPLNEEQSQEGVQNDHSYIIRTILKIAINNGVNKLRYSVPDPSELPNYSLSVNRDDRSVDAFLKNVEFRGLSNINVDNINVNIWGTKATVILRLPKVELDCGNSGLIHTIYDANLSATTSGTVSVKNIVIVLSIDINAIRLVVTNVDVGLNFVGSVQSNLKVKLLGVDISHAVNDLVEKVLPSVLDVNKCKLEEILRGVALKLK